MWQNDKCTHVPEEVWCLIWQVIISVPEKYCQEMNEGMVVMLQMAMSLLREVEPAQMKMSKLKTSTMSPMITTLVREPSTEKQVSEPLEKHQSPTMTTRLTKLTLIQTMSLTLTLTTVTPTEIQALTTPRLQARTPIHWCLNLCMWTCQLSTHRCIGSKLVRQSGKSLQVWCFGTYHNLHMNNEWETPDSLFFRSEDLQPRATVWLETPSLSPVVFIFCTFVSRHHPLIILSISPCRFYIFSVSDLYISDCLILAPCFTILMSFSKNRTNNV